jgi:hypothetical protein
MDNRSISDLLQDLGVIGDPDTIAEYLAMGRISISTDICISHSS